MRAAERGRRVQQRLVRDHLADQADAYGLLRVDGIAGVEQLGGLGRADDRRQLPETADVADQPALDEQLGEHRLFRGDADVGVERQLHAPADRRAVHRRDHRLAALDGGHRGRGRLEAHPHRRGGRGSGPGFADHQLLHVVAGAEGRVGAGDYHAARFRVGVGEAEAGLQLGVGAAVQRVAALGPVQRDAGDVVGHVVEDTGELFRGDGHGLASPLGLPPLGLSHRQRGKRLRLAHSLPANDLREGNARSPAEQPGRSAPQPPVR